ncbi:MAG: hypothetical protein A2V83_06255 [Nitrospirae bacterium RBG_16_64_22]|nr:MAG: hypothetical protein A2V83_06255 [Nitrospirae bacterium RBG_16_64_22]
MSVRKSPAVSRSLLAFLEDLASNNDRTWFEKNRGRYEEYVLRPLKALVKELAGFMLSIDPDLDVRPRVGGTISRIVRDTRFSRDKSPYRSTVWIVFKRPGNDWGADAPAFFFEVTSKGYRCGMGFYSASPETMRRFREAIDRSPREFLKIARACLKQNWLTLEGETYKRVLDASKPAEIQDWYQRKSLYLVRNRPIEKRLFDPRLVADLIRAFRLATPLYRFLWEVKTTVCSQRIPPGRG